MTSKAKDTWFLVAGIVAFLALMVYLGVAFANAPTVSTAGSAPSPTNEFAPWVPKYHSTLALLPRHKGGGIAVHVGRGWLGQYGAVVPTLAAQPPLRSRVVVRLWLRGPGKTPIHILVDEFPAGPSPNLIDTTVPATARWHRYTFSARVKGRWLGLGMFVGRDTSAAMSKWFAVRGLNVQLR